MPPARHDRVKRLEDRRRKAEGHGLDVVEMTDQQLEVVIGIPGLNTALDQMSQADAANSLGLLLSGTPDDYGKCKAIISRAERGNIRI